MRAHQEHFEQIRNAELAETQRLEEAEKRRSQEKERRVQQEKERVAREAQVTEKVAARTFTKGFLSELQTSVVSNLQDAGFFYDPLEAEVSGEFMPWLMDGVAAESEKVRTAQKLADDLLDTALEKAIAMQQEALEAYKAKVAAEGAFEPLVRLLGDTAEMWPRSGRGSASSAPASRCLLQVLRVEPPVPVHRHA